MWRGLPTRSVVVDTSVLHAYLLPGDKLHSVAVALLSSVDGVVVPGIVVHELVWSLRRKLGADGAGRLVSWALDALNARVEPIVAEDVRFALSNVKRYQDMLVLHVAMRLKGVLATLDADMIRLAKRFDVPLLKPERARVRGVGGRA